MESPQSLKRARVEPNGKESTKESAQHSTIKLPPKYGEQSYWEDRYERLLLSKEKGKQDENDEDAPLAFHSWYFSYDELRPILMPLILGGRHEVQQIFEDIQQELEEDEKEKESTTKDASPTNTPAHGETDTKDSVKKPRLEDSKPGSPDYSAMQQQKEDDEEQVIVEEDEDDEEEEEDDKDHSDQELVEIEEDEFDEEEDEESSVDRGEGLAADGPIRILEIGCGDVPLGVGLAKELIELQNSTGAKASNIAESILCADYSPAVIKKMNQQHRDLIVEPASTVEASCPKSTVLLKFLEADARHLPLEKESISLILEKGTLDALLSDPDEGIKNCQATLHECARVLAIGGCMVIISHWNAHTSQGQNWLQDVVFGGLEKTLDAASDSNFGWEIEVHGKDEASLIKDGEDESKQGHGSAPSGSPGPAVYVISKLPKGTKRTEKDGKSDEKDKTIPVRFYSY